ncbi:hypothetical protein PFICI_07632 [Pestalotiopsis fici W106-1]|uniref:Heterokaryon incompatibility domain-containing protein n=1 Tax=Pestalotiopsis fici (strain W106-1 / CGMCC3.15140) TaxID=1229662 RepID=W3X1U4_PESFW|nr:uncharacterized protein PFICI_07632 [Pestalotiopsis fici W106-1]ETS80103.1 hypothetical protein PFICI_07632 [Pestalotiopsis fici W106-1]
MPEEITFAYQPLSAEAETRIIELQPAPDASFPLQCRIAELCLSNKDLTEYEAISYTWGGQVLSECLYVLGDDGGGQSSVIKITANLRDALQRFRRQDRARRIWADAICIDQRDDSDKAKQIPAMAQIFSGASCVLVWLGCWSEGQRSLADIKKAVRFRSTSDTEIDAHMLNLERSFLDLVQLPWFSRRWIIQEVTLASDVLMVCGSEEVTFLHLLRVMNGLLRHMKPRSSTTIDTALASLLAISQLWKTWVFDSSQEKGLRLFDLLNSFHDSGCADDHDRVFALCNLASDCSVVKNLDEARPLKISLVIDYDQPVGSLYKSVVKQMLGLNPDKSWIRNSDDPRLKEIMIAVLERCDGIHRDGIPAWVPDWRLPQKRVAFFKVFKERDGEIHRNLLARALFSGRLEHLMNGRLMGLVTSVFEPFPKHMDMLEIKNYLQILRISFQSCTNDFSRELPNSTRRLNQYFDLHDSPLYNRADHIHRDSAWCLFLAHISLHWLKSMAPGSVSGNMKLHAPASARNLYRLSLGNTDVDTGSEFCLFYCSVFRGRRLFSFKGDSGVRGIFGVGIGPDHMAADTRFEMNDMAVFWYDDDAYTTLLWNSQAEPAHALVGDVWYSVINQGRTDRIIESLQKYEHSLHG